jgi:hypothetical protein
MKAKKSDNKEDVKKIMELCTYLAKNKMMSKDDTIETLLSKMLCSNDIKKEVEKEVKKVKVNIPDIINDIYHKDENIFILELAKNYAFLIKRKEESVTRVLCPGTMSPVEQQKDVTIFDFFALWWESDKKQKPIKQLEPLEEYGIPIYFVESEYDVKKCIDDL